MDLRSRTEPHKHAVHRDFTHSRIPRTSLFPLELSSVQFLLSLTSFVTSSRFLLMSSSETFCMWSKTFHEADVRGVELTKVFSMKDLFAIRSVITRHPPCSVVWTAGQVICMILRTMNSLDFSTDENWVCNRQITWFAGKRPPLFPACLIYGPMPLKSWWKFIVCLLQVFSDMVCVNTCGIARVVCVYPLLCCPDRVLLYIWLRAMLGPWLDHC